MTKRRLLLSAAVLVGVSLSAGVASAQVSCAGVPAFQECLAYPSGASVVYNNHKYTSIVPIPDYRDCPARGYPYNPGNDNWWTDNGLCSGGATATATTRPRATATATARPTATSRATATATSRA